MSKNNELKKVKKDNTEVSKYDFMICPNCGHEEVGKYCPNCGQSNKDFNKPIKEIFDDLLDSINLDIRLINTLVPFFTKPGFLAQEYFKGRRKKYVPPLRMYMMVSIVFFFLLHFVGMDKLKDIGKVVPTSAEKENRFLFAYNDTKVKSLDSLTQQEREKIKEDVLADSSMADGVKKAIIGGVNTKEKKGYFYEKFLKNISYVLFFLMPFFAAFLALILWKSKKLYVNHLIFSINFHAFIFGLSTILILLGMIIPDKYSGFLSYFYWGIPLYLILGIKRFYNRTYVSAFFKTVGALLLYTFVICMVIVVILIITAKGFYEV